MESIKKEWKTILFILWLCVVTYFLFDLNGRVNQLQVQNQKLISTLDSVESIAISTDANVLEIDKKVDSVNGNVSFIVQKIRRR